MLECLDGAPRCTALKEANLVCTWRRRKKRSRSADEKPQRVNERWVPDLMQVLDAYVAARLWELSKGYQNPVTGHPTTCGIFL